jgi:hypothetical protein
MNQSEEVRSLCFKIFGTISSSKSKSNSKDKEEAFVATDIIDENLESKMDYLNIFFTTMQPHL